MYKSTLTALAAATLLPVSALAVEPSFDGFLTIGAGTVSESGIEYAGYDDEVSFEPDTVGGVQLSAQLTDKLNFTGQVVMRGSEDFEVDIEWAYLSYDINDSFTVRAGRLRPPFFVVSDFYDIGYAYPWARPVEEVYQNIPFTNYEGADVIFNTSLGNWDATVQAYVGSEDGNQDYRGSNAERKLEDLMGIAFTIDRNSLSLRASYHQADVTFALESLDPLLAGLRATPFASVADDIEIDQKAASFIEVAATYDVENWFVRAEATTTDYSRGLIADQRSWYVTGGLYFEQFTPYATVSGLRADPEDGYSDPIPFGLDPTLDFLKATVDGLIAGSEGDEIAYTVGTRWNVLDSTAVKVEATRVNDKLAGGVDFNVYSVVVNVLF